MKGRVMPVITKKEYESWQKRKSSVRATGRIYRNALGALRDLHREEFDALYEQLKEAQNE